MLPNWKAATGRGRQAPKLLRTVGGKPHATNDDHEETQERAREPPRKKLRRPPPLDADPQSSSDIERSPESSGAEEGDASQSTADIPSSHGSGVTAKKFNGPAPQRERPRNGGPDGANERLTRATLRGVAPLNTKQNDKPKKTARPEMKKPPPLASKAEARKDLLSDDENVDMFGQVGQKKKKKRKTIKYGESKSSFQHPTSVPNSVSKKPTPTFKKVAPFPTPSSSNENKSLKSQDDDTYAGAESHVDELARESTPRPQLRRPKDKSKPSSQLTNASSQETPKFKEVPLSLTQAISKLDQAEIEKDIQEHKRLEKLEKLKADLAVQLPEEGPCPMQCGKILPRHILDTLSENASVREQQRFCHNHQLKEAEKLRKTHGWPEVNWLKFPKRLENMESMLLKMFNEPERLHFRKAMAERIKTGSRNLRQQMDKEGFEGFGAGYYGLKGHDMMTSHISKNFATQLEKHTRTDVLMSAQGAMAYVQEVLVPELATVLIQEDKNVTVLEARRILKDSTWVGDLLYPSEAGGMKSRRTSLDDLT
jgi:hypothetical protein